ncbi:unnamed protein product [Rotaria sordida]|uniref:Cation/H+ exchanger transmembrane domain-containing protein n=1 Tax=Rotaria sordida TaxID=392033 RepID=A0A813NVZ0_9BILA|nr:unnamed protein product [Rotaria sordida]CAF0885458.1 unnamed protein product [Rotaria sordida]
MIACQIDCLDKYDAYQNYNYTSHVRGWSEAIWPESSLPAFQLIANLGLLFFMFFLGLELDLDQIKNSWKTTIPIACASIIFPVGIGCAVALWFYDMNSNFQSNKIAFILFVASGFGFSAFPVLATLLNSNGLLNKPIGVQTISLAAVEDSSVWVILAIASAFSSGDSVLHGLYTLLLTIAFIAIMVFIIRPILKRLHGFYLRRNDDTNVYLVVICFLLLVAAAFTTEVMGNGLCLPRKGELTNFLGLRIELIIVEFFLPLYFANSGLRTRLDLLTTGQSWWTLVVLIFLASIAKILPVALMSKLCTKKSWSYCSSMGVLMNTRGIVQLVVLNIGVELKVISPIIFAIFVLMATVLTFLTSPIVYLLYRRGADKEKLSMDDVTEELDAVREGYNNMVECESTIYTISNGEIINIKLNSSQANSNANRDQSEVIGNIVEMPTCPRRVLNMTRF